MTHIRPISRTPGFAQIDLLESVILLLFGVFFRDFDNVFPIIESLQKFYAKTP